MIDAQAVAILHSIDDLEEDSLDETVITDVLDELGLKR